MPRAKETDNPSKTSAAAIRIRENQRRSRARRKEYVEGMQKKLQDFESKGVNATLEMQQAARDVAIENSRLRMLLAHNGIGNDVIDGFLHSFHNQDGDDAEAQLISMHSAEETRTKSSAQKNTMATLFPEHAQVDKLAVLASASVQHSYESESHYSLGSDDATMTAPSTGPVTPTSTSLNTPSPSEVTYEPSQLSCDAAAHIIAQMHGCGDSGHLSKAQLDLGHRNDYLAQTPAFIQILEAAAIFN